MGDYIFEVVDKTGRKIRLTNRQWGHINKRHPAVANYFEKFKGILQSPDMIKNSNINKGISLYYKYDKNLKSPNKYFLMIVKYLNGDGFIVSVFFEKDIK